MRTISYAEAVREALLECGRRDPNVLFFAAGVNDPSGVFGTTRNLGEACAPQTLIETPIAENAMVGIAVGAAMVGKRPVISSHRVEFLVLALDQILNNAAKAHYISGGLHRIPLVLRMVIGRGWGQGPEHSQSVEALFAMMPGLKVVMPAFPADAKGLVTAAIQDDNPVCVLEHRWCHYVTGHVPEGFHSAALDGPKVVREGKDVTIVATSYMTLEAMRAATALQKLGVDAEVIDLRVLRPLNVDPILASVRKTGRLLTVDTGWRTYGIGAEIVARVATQALSALQAPPVRIGLPDHPVPASHGMVPGVYPDAVRIIREAAALAGAPEERIREGVADVQEQRKHIPVDVPDPFFKGPF